MAWFQHDLVLPRFDRGIHPVTRLVLEAVPEIARMRIGFLHIFLQHTSASLTVNENADPDVLVDLDRALDAAAPEDFAYQHTLEGPDDMPAHVKSSLFGCSLLLPIRNGRLALGTWQGICLCEHRKRAGRRTLVLTLHGEPLDFSGDSR